MSVRIVNRSTRDKTFAKRMLAVIPMVEEILFEPDWIEVSPDHTVAWLGYYEYDGERTIDYVLQIHGYNVYIYNVASDGGTGVYQGEFKLI